MKKIHMIGIKGSGMSALACILHDNGYTVTGSDINETLFTEKSLRDRGIPIMPFQKQNIENDHFVIAGNAFPDDHEEVAEAKKKAAGFQRYHTFLGEWMNDFTSIAITGAHGKTSTTGLLSAVFSNAFPTSYLIGDGTGKGTEHTSHFVFEACEYRRHFHAYRPSYAVITNIDFDHPDYFSSIEDVKEAFATFAKGVTKGIVACGDDEHAKEVQANVPIYTYGLKETNDIQARYIAVDKGVTHFELWKDNSMLAHVTIPLVGTHHIQNSLAVLTVALLENVPLEKVQEAFWNYQGVKRRFQKRLEGETVVVDDYAHHPTEIRATLETARKTYPTKQIVAIFQPHTFTRTKTFLSEFATSLTEADEVYLCPIFGSAREQAGELDIRDLQKKIPNSHLLTDTTMDGLTKKKESVMLFMGAGDIQKYEDRLLEKLKASSN